MKKIKITAFGRVIKNDEIYLLNELYTKRIKFYSELDLVELNEPNYENATASLLEAKAMLENRIAKDDFLICCDLKGEKVSSEGFSNLFEQFFRREMMHFIVGGSLGIPKEIVAKASKVISFSDMTFPHKLFRVMLLEQIYRSFTLINGQKYHK